MLANSQEFFLNTLMDRAPDPRRRGPPHNPSVRALIQHKRRWSSLPKRKNALLGFRGRHERGYLPRRDETGLTQFITFRLKDSFPASLRCEWGSLLQVEDERTRRALLEAYLDKGSGACHLRHARVGRLVDEAMRFYHGKRCEMLAWVVMPNHVHALLRIGATPLSVLVADWKEYTAREANRTLQLRGAFWAANCWDTFMKDPDHELKACRYIENNPVKAGLVRDPKDWPFSSARFRDECGVLRF